MTAKKSIQILAALLLAAGCPGGHDEGEHGHGHGHGHGRKAGPEPVALTLWTDTHELFVEFDPLVAGRESAYHAHVTRVADNKPATAGVFAVHFERGAGPDRRVEVKKVLREGIFRPRGRSAPAGKYRLVFTFAHGDERARWDAGEIRLGSKPREMKGQAEGGITFLKEAQWRIPFRVEQPVKRPMARTLSVPATVTADPRHSRTLAAPAAGAVFWATAAHTTVVGMKVKQGQVLGRLLPAAAPEHWSTLQLQIQRAQIERQRAQQNLTRISGLATDGLLPARRLLEGRAAVARSEAALRAARSKIGQLRGRRTASLPLVAPAAGTIVELHVTSGHTASAGAVVGHVAQTSQVLVRAEVFSLDLQRLERIRWARLRRAGAAADVRLDAANSALLTQRVVVDPDTLSAPLIYRVRNDSDRLIIGDLVELTLGVGRPDSRLTVPLSAVVEINTRPYMIVMRTGESFDRRPVQLGPSDGQRVAVLAGLAATDRVVSQGAFDVYAASLAGAVESHRH